MPTNSPCPFCAIDPRRIIYEDEHCFAVRDGFPVAAGHSLVISKRHVATYFATSAEERAALLRALDEVKQGLDREFAPAAYNIGINDGAAAGQTVPHLHIHLIPRYHGDCDDPRGGVRWVVPDKANYWGK